MIGRWPTPKDKFGNQRGGLRRSRTSPLLEIDRCPLCGSKNSETIFSHARLANIGVTYASRESRDQLTANMNTDLCLNCGMLFRKPLMSEEEQEKYYEESYHETFKLELEKKNDIHTKIRKYRKNYVSFLLDNGIGIKDKKVLDVGCGNGWFLASIKELNPKYLLGIEPSKQACQQRINSKEMDFEVLEGGIEDISMEKTGQFDLITSIGVIEHLSDPAAHLNEIRLRMHEDSMVYIYTLHEYPCWFIDLNKSLSLVHQLYFTQYTIQKLFDHVGLKVEVLKSRNNKMHILARKTKPRNVKFGIEPSKLETLRKQYLFYKKVPSPVFSVLMQCQLKYFNFVEKITGKRCYSTVINRYSHD